MFNKEEKKVAEELSNSSNTIGKGTTVEGNIRKLIGGSALISGVYNIPVKAINYNGEDSEILVLNVSNPPFSNTKSIRFNNNDYLSATPTVSNPLYRPSGSFGSAYAWSFSLWFKAGTSSQSEQTVIMFGGSDQNNEGRVQCWYNGSNNDKNLRLLYGTGNNNLVFETPSGSITQGVWSHVLMCYDGGSTGQSQGDINDYYSRFKIYIDNVLQTTSNTNNNYGWSGSVKNEFFRVGRNGSNGNYMRNGCLVDELALFNSDESLNASGIYNGGTPFDLSGLPTPPVNWWRMGDEDTYPTLSDNIGSSDFTMQNMTSSDIVNDTP